ncbi:hypothetical protein Celaphus_00010270 [Cervus elaphus hippelaphus]|uniref:Pyrin domain-containing protein n=1 Tax=Cervus elaphus hippelaphus TaxID=46360 RepID=A0A212C9B5_CEREH|nr:hypothetical protein Celaphus_00010270 [Cervus elaphus hippelaphus]
MEGSLGSGRRSRSDGQPAPAKISPATEELQSRLQETLDLLSSQELRSFRDHLKKVEPRASQVKLELEGHSSSGLAGLLAKLYPPAAAKRVLVQVLELLPRADLLPRWQSAPTDCPDHVALRDPRTGSVMIKEMTEVFKQYGNKWHIADFFTIVNNRVVHRLFSAFPRKKNAV